MTAVSDPAPVVVREQRMFASNSAKVLVKVVTSRERLRPASGGMATLMGTHRFPVTSEAEGEAILPQDETIIGATGEANGAHSLPVP